MSALDVSIQAQILNLLSEIKERFGLTLIFISHNLSVVRHVSDRIMVLYLGRMVELASGDDLYEDPKHPYTRALLTAVPIPDPRRARQRNIDALEGEIPSPINQPSGCTFRTRCRYAIELCAEHRPPLEAVDGGPAGGLPPLAGDWGGDNCRSGRGADAQRLSAETVSGGAPGLRPRASCGGGRGRHTPRP